MAKISSHQEAANTLLDFFYYAEMCFLRNIDCGYRLNLNELEISIETNLVDYKIIETERDIYKHYILCCLEIYYRRGYCDGLNNEISENMEEAALKIVHFKAYSEMLFILFDEKPINKDVVLQVVNKIIKKYQINTLNTAVINQLTLNVFLAEFQNVALHLFSHLLSFNLLHSNKSKVDFKQSEMPNGIIQRLFLIIEHYIFCDKFCYFVSPDDFMDSLRSRSSKYVNGHNDISKDILHRLIEFSTDNPIFTLDCYQLDNRDYLQSLLEKFNTDFLYQRQYACTQGKWLSLFAALWVYREDKALLQALPVFNADPDHLCLCKKAEKVFTGLGYSVKAKSIYNQFNELKKSICHNHLDRDSELLHFKYNVL